MTTQTKPNPLKRGANYEVGDRVAPNHYSEEPWIVFKSVRGDVVIIEPWIKNTGDKLNITFIRAELHNCLPRPDRRDYADGILDYHIMSFSSEFPAAQKLIGGAQ